MSTSKKIFILMVKKRSPFCIENLKGSSTLCEQGFVHASVMDYQSDLIKTVVRQSLTLFSAATTQGEKVSIFTDCFHRSYCCDCS